MKKTLLGIAGILAMVSSANAVDTAQIKAACQASDKTLWVESNQVCIPRNPCKDSKFEAYCNRDFINYAGMKNDDFAALVRIYTKVNKFDCPYGASFELFEQEHILICNEDDYTMVFQFPSYLISDALDNDYSKFKVQEKFFDIVCDKIFDGQCEKTQNTQYTETAAFDHIYWNFNIDTKLCSIIRDNSPWFMPGKECKFSISFAH